MERVNGLRSLLPSQDLTFLAGVPYVYHCHHYNLFHDQTIDDALGEELGTKVRTRAAHNAARELLQAIAERLGAETPIERVQLAQNLFAWMGHGTLKLDVEATGGRAEGSYLHYGYSWTEKYGARVRRVHPADAFAAGFAAAATELAWNLPAGSITAVEEKCLVLRDSGCSFQLRPSTPFEAPRRVDQAAVEPHVAPSFGGLEEETISAIADGLRGFLSGVRGDQRGLVQAFSVFVTAHLSNYYSETIYEAVHQLEKSQPGSVSVAESLFREAGQVCVFNTFGNILLSPEWEGMVGAPTGDPMNTLTGCCAIARGLGFGHWTLHAFSPKELVLRASCNYEAPFYLSRYGKSDKARCYIFQGAALAMMVLAMKVKWTEQPKLTQDFYISLFRGKIPWKVRQTQCQTRGDAIAEVTVSLG